KVQGRECYSCPCCAFLKAAAASSTRHFGLCLSFLAGFLDKSPPSGVLLLPLLRLFEGCGCVLFTTKLLVRACQQEVRSIHMRIKLYGALELGYRLLELSVLNPGAAEGKPGVRRHRIDANRLTQVMDRAVIFLCEGVADPQPIGGVIVEWPSLFRLGVVVDRFIVLRL